MGALFSVFCVYCVAEGGVIAVVAMVAKVVVAPAGRGWGAHGAGKERSLVLVFCYLAR